MVSLRELSIAMFGAWRFATLDRSAVQFFDNTPEAFWRSFNAALVALPARHAGGHDQVVAGSVDLGEALLNVTLGYTPATNDSFIIVNNTGASAVTGTFEGLAEGDTITVSDVTLQITYAGGDGNDVELRQVPIYDFSAATFSVSEDAASGTATVTNTVFDKL